MPRPDLKRVPEYYHKYIALVAGNELMPALQKQTTDFTNFLASIPPAKRDYRYAPGKWTIKEVLQHIIDGERIFSYRALCFARMDATPLPGFDENTYAENAKVDKRNWDELVEEFKVVRKSTEILFGSFDEEQLDSQGIASGNPNYVTGIGYIIIGHANHHINMTKERYLAPAN